MDAAFESLEQTLLNRRSCRAFKADPVPHETLERVLAPAMRAPSNCNTQPWHLHVASGATVERLRTRLPEDFMGGKMSLDFPYDGKYDGDFKDRQYASAQALYSAMGIEREDKAARNVAFMRNFTFFDAPHLGIFCLPQGFTEREACDLGMFAQSVMLLLESAGIQSCPQTALGFLSDSLREELQIPEDQRVMFGLSFGYPIEDAPANSCRTDREDLASLIHFHG